LLKVNFREIIFDNYKMTIPNIYLGQPHTVICSSNHVYKLYRIFNKSDTLLIERDKNIN